jgi:hypothetical protein
MIIIKLFYNHKIFKKIRQPKLIKILNNIDEFIGRKISFKNIPFGNTSIKRYLENN